MNGYNDDDNEDKDDDFEDDFEMPAERRFEVGVRGTPSSGMQYLHLKLHLVMLIFLILEYYGIFCILKVCHISDPQVWNYQMFIFDHFFCTLQVCNYFYVQPNSFLNSNSKTRPEFT